MKHQYHLTKEMPNDVIIEILKRLPAKSIARLRCVSREWASILRHPVFTKSFLRVSSTRPCLLFTFKLSHRWLFLSSPQPLTPQHNSSTPIVLNYHMSFSRDSSLEICAPVRGLLCTKARNPMICNPSTGQSIILPKATTSTMATVKTFFGFDPVDDLFKVLSVSTDDGYRVLTLGTGQVSWRMLECFVPHVPVGNGIYINGVHYYLAECNVKGNGPKRFVLVCFDFRFEKFEFQTVHKAIWGSTLINYKGSLGAVGPDTNGFINGNTKRLVLWVLEKQIWLKRIFVLPSFWKYLVETTWLEIVGMTATGELVFSPCSIPDPFYIFYYSLERNTLVRVEIDFGLLGFKGQKIYTFIDHVEDVKRIGSA